MMQTGARLWSPEDLAEYLGVPVRSVYGWRSKGSSPRGVRVGKHVRFRPEDVAVWLEERADKPESAA